MKIQEQLRNACNSIRTKSFPISDLIPLMQKAADAFDAKDAEIDDLESECRSLSSECRYWHEQSLENSGMYEY